MMSRILTLALVLAAVEFSFPQTPSSTLALVSGCHAKVKDMLGISKVPVISTETFIDGVKTHTQTLIIAYQVVGTSNPNILVFHLRLTVKGEEVSASVLRGWYKKGISLLPIHPTYLHQPVVDFQDGDRVVFVYAVMPKSGWKETWVLLTGNVYTRIPTWEEFLVALGAYLALGEESPQSVCDLINELPFVTGLFLKLHTLSKQNPQFQSIAYALSETILRGDYPQQVILPVNETKAIVVNPRRWAELEGKNFEDAVSTMLAWDYLPEEEQQPSRIAGGNNQPSIQISIASSSSMPPLLPSIEEFYHLYNYLYWLSYYRPTPYHPLPRPLSQRQVWSLLLHIHAHRFNPMNPLHRPAIHYVVWRKYLANGVVEPGDEIFAYYLIHDSLRRSKWFPGAAGVDFIIRYYLWDSLWRPSVQRLLNTPFHIDMVWREFWKAVYPED